MSREETNMYAIVKGVVAVDKLPELLPNSLSGWVINKTQEQKSFRLLSIFKTFVQLLDKPVKQTKSIRVSMYFLPQDYFRYPT